MAYSSNAAYAVIPATRPNITILSGANVPTFSGDLFTRFIDYTDRKETTV